MELATHLDLVSKLGTGEDFPHATLYIYGVVLMETVT
jgi:hypothetical protein